MCHEYEIDIKLTNMSNVLNTKVQDMTVNGIKAIGYECKTEAHRCKTSYRT